jgi:predicted RNase H-like HicB family nuclease
MVILNESDVYFEYVEDGYHARYKELPVLGYGESREEALENLKFELAQKHVLMEG